MIVENEFRVALPVEQAWAVLTDLPGIAPCLPGAQLTAVDADVYHGTVRVKVGPIVTEYAGTARFQSADSATHEAVILAQGAERRGGGTASATIRATLRGDDDGDGAATTVHVHTDLRIAGRVAQFGAGAIQQISATLMDQFAANLQTKLAANLQTKLAASSSAADAAESRESAEEVSTAPGSVTAADPLSVVVALRQLLRRRWHCLQRRLVGRLRRDAAD